VETSACIEAGKQVTRQTQLSVCVVVCASPFEVEYQAHSFSGQ